VAAATGARKEVATMAPPGMMEKVGTWLAEYRTAHKVEKR